MHELLAVWKDRDGLKFIALTALVYALVLIPFNQLHGDVAGITVRPAAALPVVLGIFWGPAAAWGLGIGNIAGDYFGSWSLMSIFGFLVNVLYPYLSYLLWHRLMQGQNNRTGMYGMACFLLVTIVVTTACMALLAACGTIFFARPFESKFAAYFFNGIVWAMVAGPALFFIMGKYDVIGGWHYGREWDRGDQ